MSSHRRTDRQKVMHMSPPCIRTGGLKNLTKDIKQWKQSWLKFCDLAIDHRTSNTSGIDGSVDLDIDQIEKLHQLQVWIEKLDLKPIATSAKESLGLAGLVQCMNESLEGSKEVIPQGWFETLQQIQNYKDHGKGSIAFDELEGMYYRYGASYDLDVNVDDDVNSNILSDNTRQKCKEFLHYLHDTGMVLWFSNSKPLNEVIFHDREFLVGVLRSIFHHNLREILKYKPHIQNLTATGFKEHLDNFLNCGILSEALLEHIWDETEYKQNEALRSYIMELLQSLNLCFEKKNSVEISWHFPWFVRKEDSKALIGKEWNPALRENEIALEFCYKFCHRLPMMIYEQLSVAIQRNVYPGDMRHDWKDIIYIRSNGVKMMIQRFPYEEHPSIQVSLRTQVSNIQAMYELCLRVNVDLQMLLDICPGVVFDSFLICPHCLLIDAPNKKHWNLSLIENYARQDWMTCSAVTPAVDIPSAMVYFMTVGE